MLIDVKVWLNHFEYHAERRHALLPEFGPRHPLTPVEHARIAQSIATFQLGEQSDGRYLMRAACVHARKVHAPEIVRLIQLFIGEEQMHAGLIGNFMDRHDIARRNRDWTDNLFRLLRRLAGFELHLTVLLTAELIGKVYYRALESATANSELRLLCRALVADELAHIGFESDLLNDMREGRSRVARAIIGAAHRNLLKAAAIVVWATHRPVLSQAGYRLRSFLAACDAQYSFYLGADASSAPKSRSASLGDRTSSRASAAR